MNDTLLRCELSLFRCKGIWYVDSFVKVRVDFVMLVGHSEKRGPMWDRLDRYEGLRGRQLHRANEKQSSSYGPKSPFNKQPLQAGGAGLLYIQYCIEKLTRNTFVPRHLR